ncbi:Chromatin structure-remodeling complex subunit snf21 [Ceratocystis platani]|uniref:Chromatin structure-remodeling complex subunit snf21 n=1 Tax=Ceratocystis fimbriata f. sp. platani TaxID=88771 RepID=A0A0F8B1P9_CERFI|nr:Chromatin structure-remodeling complex subunit snf21 [Ceratocystis platani]
MATLPSPMMPQHQGLPLSMSINKQEVEAAVRKLKDMKDQGIPQTDPDFIKTQNFINSNNNNNNNSSSIHHHSSPPYKTIVPQMAYLMATLAPSVASHFSTQQLALLRNQIGAFRLLSKNAGVPQNVQQTLFAQRLRRKMAVVEALSALAPASTGLGASPASNQTTVDPIAAPLSNGDPASLAAANANIASGSGRPDATKGPLYTKYKTPLAAGLIKAAISFNDHASRSHRLFVPGMFPLGLDLDSIRYERETAIINRMRSRYAELKELPADLAHWDVANPEVQPEETLKLKALVEKKAIEQFGRQRILRESVARQMLFFENLGTTTNRSRYRRVKKHNVREARITEKLEKQQRDARENRERKKQDDFLRAISSNRNEINNLGISAAQRGHRLAKIMYNQHFNIEKEEQKRIERTAKQRLQALKANDEEAYLKLLDQAKDTRITHLLRQTDGFLHQLASSVKAQQRRAAEHYGNGGDFEESDEDNEHQDEETAGKIDYYAVAHRIKEEVTEQADILVGGKLKEYQIKGLQWMVSLYNNNLNGILADEMGLGKTIQTISLITYLIERKQQPGPFLVIVPLSVLTNWNLEFDRWAPSVGKIVYKGPPNARRQQQDRIRQGNFQVLLTTYEYIIKDRPLLSKIKWFHMIIDEGHRMKNAQSKLSATIQTYYQTRFRLILTGTPLQNNLGELWAMLNFVLPNIFKSATTFDEWFNTPFANTGSQDKIELTEEEQILVIRRLHKVLRPFLLRRLKKDVEKDLPDKTEKVIKCKFSSLQSKLYKQMVTHNKIAVGEGKNGKTGARGLSNMIMQLRKLCNHPFVFDEVETVLNPLNISNDMLWRTAGKFELLDRILPKYQASGHRVLMFFQMTAIMDIMEDYLRYRHFEYLRLDGTTKSDERSDLLRDFNAPDSKYFMFLLSTRAGGLGLNLQTADTVIIYDSDWNPHQDLQAQDRAHRIGQKNEVRILRLISSNSVEEKILERARFKLDMDGKVIQAGRFDNKSSETDRDAMLRTLLESADMAEQGDPDDMDDEELNEIIARNDNELKLFQEMDDKRMMDPLYGTNPGCQGKPRLMAENELPEIYLNEGNPDAQEEEEVVLGRGARERTRIKYDDGLTEEQWLMAVDDDDDTPEEAAARKEARKDRREANRLRKVAIINNLTDSTAVPPSPSQSQASTEEIETPKKRGRKPGSKNAEKRKADDGDEPPAKKRRGPIGRPKGSTNAPRDPNRLPPAQRALLQTSLRKLFDGLMNLETDDLLEPPPNDDESDPGKRLIIGPFVKLPPKREYADYYMIIQNPICMSQIEKKIKKEEYKKLSDMRSDIELMLNNCRTYNEDGSVLYKDANMMEDFFVDQLNKLLDEHVDLRAMEIPKPSQADVPGTAPASTAASASATPTTDVSAAGAFADIGVTDSALPAVPPRIKLISNAGSKEAASAAPTDEDKENEGQEQEE